LDSLVLFHAGPAANPETVAGGNDLAGICRSSHEPLKRDRAPPAAIADAFEQI